MRLAKACALLAIACATAAPARSEDPPPGSGQGGQRGPGRRGGGGAGQDDRGGPVWTFRTETPARVAEVVAGRPGRTSVTLSARTSADAEGWYEWKRDGASETQRTPSVRYAAGVPVETKLEGLAPGAAYVATFFVRSSPEAAPAAAAEPVRIRTQRPRGEAFTFTVQADSHLDQNTQPALYERTMRHVAAGAPDFHVDLGDTFMTDKRRDDFRAALPQYAAQRWYLGLGRVPVFLTLGNHDGENGWRARGDAADMPQWSLAQRRANFPNPEPDGFYTGNAERDATGAAYQDWYGWEWGDAQFLVLDPFRTTTDRRGKDADGWSWTLGTAQTKWLETSLATSRARVRFVFIHHLVGGLGPEARGGSEAAKLFEWGGRSADGTDAFAARRPGWTAPIHDLLRKAGNVVVFHGHDHFWARQDLDGVIYQMVPQPGHPGSDAKKMAAEYGYVAGEFLPSPGHVRVRVDASGATVELVRSSLVDPRADGVVGASYAVPAGKPR